LEARRVSAFDRNFRSKAEHDTCTPGSFDTRFALLKTGEF
jgi:hypothetical protein